MKHPNVKKVFELAAMFDLADKATGGAKANMQASSVRCDEQNLCGTPACHAGWFGVIRDGAKAKQYYHYYADEIGKFLGLRNADELEAWAARNPIIWGNRKGAAMFCDGRAFGVDNGDEGFGGDLVSLSTIAKHWYNVGKRLAPVLEKELQELRKINEEKIKELEEQLEGLK